MKKLQSRILAIVLVIAVAGAYMPISEVPTYAATKKVKLSKKKVRLKVGKKKTIKLKNVRKKVKWKVVKGKKVVSIKKKGKLKNKIVIKAKKAGKAVIKATYKKKKYKVKVTVKNNKQTSGNAQTSTTVAPTTANGVVVTTKVVESKTEITTETLTAAPTEAPTEAPTKAPTVAPTEAPTVAPTEAPTVAPTTADPNKPAAPIGLTSAGSKDLPFYFAWAMTEGVTYNFYINDTKIESGIVAGFYNCDSKYFTTVGDYKISVTAEKNGYESDKATIDFKVTKDNVATTVAPTEASTEAPTVAPTEASTEAPTVTPTDAPTEAPTEATTKAPEDASHVVKNPGVQEEAADSQVASDISLTPYLDGIDDKLSSTKGNTSNNEGIENLFDNNVNTKFFTNDAPAITIAWKMKRAVTLKSYTFVLAGDASTYKHRDPHSWAVYASMDGENWTTVSDIDNGGITHTNNGE